MLRTYGRTYDVNGVPTWKEVTTDDAGFDDAVWLTTLIQCMKLNLNESPFFSNWGIPAHPALIQQVFPDYYVAIMAQQFARYFASLSISKEPDPVTPTYRADVITNQGAKISVKVPV